jgi:HlyD family secretion protein
MISMGLLALLMKSPVVPEVSVTQPSVVTTVVAEPALHARGYVIPHHRINVNSKVTGRVAWIGVERGEKVKQDQILVRLEDDEFRAQVEQTQGNVAVARAYLQQLERGSRPEEIEQAQHSLEQARAPMISNKIALERTQQLASQGVVSKQSYDDALAKFEASQQLVHYLEQALLLSKAGPRPEEIARARGSVIQAEGALAFAQSQLDATSIRAPIAGTILERTAEKGELVTAQYASGAEDGPQGSVVALADLRDVRVAVDIPQADFPRVHLKQLCTVVVDALPDRKYEGTVAEIAPEANSQKATVQIKAQILNPGSSLRPQMNATVYFGPNEARKSVSRSTIVVPASAVHRIDQKNVVWIASNGKVAVREVVTLEQRADGLVVQGLQGSENIIVSSSENLNDGDAIKIQVEAPSASGK